MLLSSLRFDGGGAKLAKNCQKIAHDLVRTKAAKAVIVFHGQVCRLLCQIVSQQLLLLVLIDSRHRLLLAEASS